MKRNNRAFKILVAVSSVFVFSCSSTKVDGYSDEMKNEANSTNVSATEEKNNNEKFQSIFLEAIDGLEITITETPKETIKNKAFATPYILKITKKENSVPLSRVWIGVKYPTSREKETFEPIYSFVVVPIETTSAMEGFIEFTPPIPTAAFNEKITFIPCVSKETSVKKENFEDLFKMSEEKAVAADFKVKTDLRSAGGVISLVEFKKDRKPLYTDSISSSRLLMNLLKLGFSKVGNDDFVNEILKGDNEKIFNATKKYNGTLSYLIFGTVKYDETPSPDVTGAVNFIGEVYCMNLKAKSTDELILFKTVQKVSEKDPTSARDALSKKLADAISYGM